MQTARELTYKTYLWGQETCTNADQAVATDF